MAYNSAHTGPEIDAAVQLLGEIQEAKNSTASDRQAVAGMAATVATQAAQVSSQAGSVSSNTAVVLASASAVESDRAEVEQNTALVLSAKDSAEDAQSTVLAAKEVVEIIQAAVSDAQVAVDLSEQNAGDSASSARSDREIVEALAIQTADDRASAAESAAAAAAVVTGGTATLEPAPGKIPLAKGDGRIDEGWLPSAIARTSALAEISEQADLATATAEATESRTARYLAPSAEAPGQRDDGLPLQTGDVYFNTADQTEYRYENGGWRSNDSTRAVELINERFSVNPEAGKTPIAGPEGRLAIGWMPAETTQLAVTRPLVVDDYHDLRTQTGSELTVLVTADWIGGLFKSIGKAAGYLDDDAITIIRNDGTVFLRIVIFPMMANWFGLKPTASRDENSAALERAVLLVNRSGGGFIDFAPGAYNLAKALPCYSGVKIRGPGMDDGIFDIQAVTDSVGFDFSFSSGSYNAGGAQDLTIYNSGVMGGSGIKTPVHEDGFLKAQKWEFERIGFRGSSWKYYFDIGDCSQGYIRDWEVRGRYDARLADAGQDASCSIRLSGARGNVGMQITGFRSIGARYFIDLGENVEGYYIDKGEATNCWKGITSSNVTPKPGGFIGPIHISANKAGIDLANRNDMNIAKVQCYRSTGMFDHGTDWVGVKLDNCKRVESSRPIIRNLVVSTGQQISADLVNCDKVMMDGFSQAEPGFMTAGIRVNGLTNSKIGECGFDGLTTTLELSGVVSNCSFGPFTGPSVPGSPVKFNGAGIDRLSVRVGHFSSVADYDEKSFSAAAAETWDPRRSPRRRKVNLTGASAFDVMITLAQATALRSDTFDVKVVITSSSASKNIKFVNDAGATIYTVAGSTSNTFMKLIFVNNGAGWVIDDAHASLS